MFRAAASRVAAFRINQTLALTSLPVDLAGGSPIIGAGGSGGGGSLPQFDDITIVETSVAGIPVVGSMMFISEAGRRFRHRNHWVLGTHRHNRTLLRGVRVLKRHDQRIHVLRHRPTNGKLLLHEQRGLQ